MAGPNALPGYGEFDTGTISEDEGKFITVPPGKYTLQVYAIEKPAEIKSKGKLADIVIILTPRAETNSVLNHKNYRLDWNKRQFLFPSARTNKLKTPKMGIEVEVHVRLDKDNNITLWRDFTHGWGQKWPSVYDEYKILLEDMSQIQEGDSLRVKTLRFDQERKVIYAELLKRRYLP